MWNFASDQVVPEMEANLSAGRNWMIVSERSWLAARCRRWLWWGLTLEDGDRWVVVFRTGVCEMDG